MEKYGRSSSTLHTDSTIAAEITGLAGLMLGSSPDGIALVDQVNLTVRVINDSALELLAVSAEEVLGRIFPIALSNDDAQEVMIAPRDDIGDGGTNALARGASSPIYVSVHKQDVVQKDRVFWLLSLRDVTARVQMREQLRSESIKDDLTGLLNRRGFVTLGQHTISLADREKRRLLIVFIDLDGMKKINDRFGHHRGDVALLAAADLLRQTFRKSDVVARMGGDEFAIIAQCKNDDDKSHIQRRLSENLERINDQSAALYRLSLSVGLVDYDGAQSRPLEDMLDLADKAMYEAKRLKQKS
ncbi:MAG: diguanylate cyclase [Cyanobacteria bacterium REEB67]|nr:diguanylate cyclase [Cyanobacteria bacterium REEB67]